MGATEMLRMPSFAQSGHHLKGAMECYITHRLIVLFDHKEISLLFT